MTLTELNALPADQAQAVFLRCCGAERWARLMTERRPFESTDAVLQAAEEIWTGLDRAAWREAFVAHPRIGDWTALRGRFAATADLCAHEQSGTGDADETTLRALAEGNQMYEDRFGHIFIVCAAGKSAGEMLDILRQRLGNEPEVEWQIAGREQALITRRRLESLWTT
jgi:2-oxo-4-hydroxy-4-carboxy-5-ureidoimidazoline decarboxylase